MNIRVTVQAGVRVHLIARCRADRWCPGEFCERIIRGPRMPAPIMTALAKLRRVADQEFGMVAAVRRMTVQAVFLDRRMLKHEGPSFFSVTFEAEFVHRIGLELIVGKGSMHIMTIGAFDQSFFDGMVRLPGCL